MSMKSKFRMVKGVLKGFSERDADPDPVVQFQQWFSEAEKSGLYLPEAVCMATTTPDGAPSARMMLLKGVDDRGFVIFTNFESRKGEEVALNPRAALVFHWNELQRQVRVEGRVEQVGEDESDEYFQSRPRGSRIGAWASEQSALLETRKELEDRVRKYQQEFKQGRIPCPPFWGGLRLVPNRIEFWQGRADRLHDRMTYLLEDGAWKIVRLSP